MSNSRLIGGILKKLAQNECETKKILQEDHLKTEFCF